jgi:hypothetical protein
MILRVGTRCERCNSLNGANWCIKVCPHTTIDILVALTLASIRLFMSTTRMLVIDEIATKQPDWLILLVVNIGVFVLDDYHVPFLRFPSIFRLSIHIGHRYFAFRARCHFLAMY